MGPDATLLYWINHQLANPVFDLVLPPFSRLGYFVPFLVLLVGWMVWKDGVRGRVTVLALLLLVPLTDQVSAGLIKPAVDRPRPCHDEAGLEWVEVRVKCGGGEAFPSSHATNMGGVAFLLGWRYRRWIPYAAGAAFLVGMSRIYGGVHYPGDVLAGWVLGALLAAPLALLAAWGERRWRGRRGIDEPAESA